jgi:tungstate transport system substrate-binding protein
MDRRGYLRALGVGGAASLAGCSTESRGSAKSPPDGSLTLATATTAYDSGLLGELNQAFQASFDARVETLVRGTGGALRTARDGDCDIVLVHARPLEDAFLRDGHGINRRSVMRNDFLLVGPPGDPAGVAAVADDPVAAFRAVHDAGAPFLSRGDRSGTHIRERRVWDAAGIDPTGSWYRETGQGMGDTLVAAGQAGAYTLTDRATFLTLRSEVDLVAHVDHGIADPPALLDNRYGIIPVDPARHDVNYTAAMAYVGHLTGPGQATIDEFRRAGEPVFEPTALSSEPQFGQYAPTDWT